MSEPSAELLVAEHGAEHDHQDHRQRQGEHGGLAVAEELLELDADPGPTDREGAGATYVGRAHGRSSCPAWSTRSRYMSSSVGRATARFGTSPPKRADSSAISDVGESVSCGSRLAAVGPGDPGLTGVPPAELVGRVEGDHAAPVDDTHHVSQGLGLLQVVGGEQDRGAFFPQRLDQGPELTSGLGVEAGGRFVEEQQLGPADDPQSHVQPSPLATRQCSAPRVRLGGQAHLRQHLLDRPGVGVVAGEVAQGLAHGEVAEVADLLQDDADLGPPVPVRPAGVDTQDVHITGVTLAVALEDLGRGRLACPVRAEQRHALSTLHDQVDAVHRVQVAVGLGQARDLDHRVTAHGGQPFQKPAGEGTRGDRSLPVMSFWARMGAC